MKNKYFGQLVAVNFLALSSLGIMSCGGSNSAKPSGAAPQPPTNVSSSSIEASKSSSSSLSSSSTSSSSSSTSAVAESAEYKGDYANFSLSTISQCGVSITSPTKALSLLGDYNSASERDTLSNFTGWNHTTNGSSTEWKNLTRTGAEYDFFTRGNPDASCNGVDTLNMILLKKYADWDHQHSNGFESHFASAELTLGQVDSLVLDLKINAAKTSIPNLAKLSSIYSTYVSDTTLSNLDASMINIGLTLYDGTNLKASTIIELDQHLLSNIWLRVSIKIRDLNFYSETNYVKTTKTYDDLKSAKLNGLLIVGETKTGSVLRGSISNWSANVPETFKEMDISFKKIELVYR